MLQQEAKKAAEASAAAELKKAAEEEAATVARERVAKVEADKKEEETRKRDEAKTKAEAEEQARIKTEQEMAAKKIAEEEEAKRKRAAAAAEVEEKKKQVLVYRHFNVSRMSVCGIVRKQIFEASPFGKETQIHHGSLCFVNARACVESSVRFVKACKSRKLAKTVSICLSAKSIFLICIFANLVQIKFL